MPRCLVCCVLRMGVALQTGRLVQSRTGIVCACRLHGRALVKGWCLQVAGACLSPTLPRYAVWVAVPAVLWWWPRGVLQAQWSRTRMRYMHPAPMQDRFGNNLHASIAVGLHIQLEQLKSDMCHTLTSRALHRVSGQTPAALCSAPYSCCSPTPAL
jgi:hypothetical protein